MTPKLPLIGAGALMAASALLSGCGQNATAQNGGLSFSDAKYCTPFKTSGEATGPAALNAALSNPAGAFDDCIHRWGYTLAKARDPADVVAQAAVNACGPIIAAWTQQASAQESAQDSSQSSTRRDRRAPQEAQQQPSPQAQQIRMAESRALFYVVQARAAGCAPPAANTLLATNTGS